jgi:hypothetical protein
MLPHPLAVNGVTQVVGALWVEFLDASNEARVRLQALFGIPYGGAVGLATVLRADAKMD